MSDVTIDSVASNLKSPDGRPWRFDLGEKTLVVGRNGRGKSAVVQAIALAISGAAEEVAGRSVVSDPALLMTLAHGGGRDGSPLFARANLSNGEHCQWETSRDGRRVKTPTHIRPAWVVPHTSKVHSPHFPLREVREVLTGSAKTARERFLAWVCSDLADDVVEAALGAHVETFKQLGGSEDDPVVDRLMGSISHADKLAKQLRASGRAQAELRDQLSSEVGARPSDAKVLAARDAVREARELHETALRNAGASETKERRRVLHELLGRKRADEQTLRRALAEAKKMAEQPASEIDDIKTQGQLGSVAAIKWALADGADICPTCASGVGRDHLEACLTFFEGEVAGATTAQEQQDKRAEQVRQASLKLNVLLNSIARDEDELNALPASSSAEVEVDTDKTRDALSAAEAKLSTLSEATAKWEQLDSAKQLAAGNMDKAEQFATYKGAAQKVVTRLLDERIDSFCERVTDYLPDGWEFGVMVTDQGRDVFYYGLYDGEGDDRFLKVGLSEAQRVTVLMAMCGVLSELQQVPLTVLSPEDRGWDAETLGEVMQAFLAMPQQVVLTSTVMPSEAARVGWKVYDLDAQAEPPPKVRSEPPVLPQGEPEGVEAAPALLELPAELQARQAPLSGRVRGGKFRSLRAVLTKFVAAHGFQPAKDAFRFAHPELRVDDDLAPEEYIVAAANYLVPIEIT